MSQPSHVIDNPPPLRRLPAPLAEPPFDDEYPPAARHHTEATQGALALVFSLPSGVPAEPSSSTKTPLLLVPGDGAHPAVREAAVREAAVRESLPVVGAWAARLVQAIVEALSGARSPAQLVRWTSREVYSAVTKNAARAPERRVQPPAVRSVHVSQPTDDVAEVCALITHPGGRVRAMALRLEGIDGRWRCTALQMG